MTISPSQPYHWERLQALSQQEQRYSRQTSTKKYPSNSLNFRKHIAPWMYKVVRALNLCNTTLQHDDLAGRILHCLDCFVLQTNITEPEHYQLAALTCLYTVVKVHCVNSLSMDLLTQKLSQDAFSHTQLEQMEWKLLQALQWQLHPPTAMDFVQELLQMTIALHDQSYNCASLDAAPSSILELASLQIKDAVQDYQTFGRYKVSHVGLAALFNALESNTKIGGIITEQWQYLEDLAQRHNIVDIKSSSFLKLRQSLHSFLMESNSDHPALRDCSALSNKSRRNNKTTATTSQDEGHQQGTSPPKSHHSPRTVYYYPVHE